MYNYNFLNGEWYRQQNNDLYRNVNTSSLFTPDDGYNKGNLFSNLYSQYKNYKPVVLKANNEREQLLLELSRIAFAAHEINLYLDLNPDDVSMITLFNDYRKKANELRIQYESKYGPLNLASDSLDQTPFMWEKNTWPWEARFNV